MNARDHSAGGAAIGDAVGKPVPRLEAREKVAGRALYTDDLSRPNMLHAAQLASPYAHARIVSVDTGAAAALPGVKAVLTGRDFPRNYTGMFLMDQLPLAVDKVRYAGEPVAAVAAEDLATAREALRLIDVDYEELDAVFDPVEALRPDAPVIHEDRGSYECHYELPPEPNAVCYSEFKEGDPQQAWARCDVVVENEYRLPAQYHMYLEPVSTLAEVDSNGKVTLWSSMQGVARVQMLTARALGLPMSKVRVIAPRVGGAFGGKCELTNQPVTAALAMAAGRPVKMTLSREDDMTMMKSRHAATIRARTGAKKDGTLVARSVEFILDGGAYADESSAVSAVCAFFSRGPYVIPNMHVRSWSVYTNRLRAGAMRGFGNPQATFVSEAQLNELAAALDMDPLELRLRNALDEGDAWLGGKSVGVPSLKQCLERVREASDWQNRRKRHASAPGKRRGIGIAGFGHTSALLSAGAAVHLNEDGTVTVNTGAVDIGQGSDTALAQIAAGTLGLELDQVNYANPDTDSSPYNYQTAASRTTFMVGTAVARASAQVRDKLLEHAAAILESEVDRLEMRPGGKVGIRGISDEEIPFAAMAGRALFAAGGPISGSSNWLYEPAEGLDPERTETGGFVGIVAGNGVFCFGAQVVEVEVDEVTGKVEVLEVWSAHDVGRAINPDMVEGQVQGSVVQGLGYALTEELVWDGGDLINPTMMDYKVPGMADVPYGIHPILLENPEPGAPFGARGVGEMALMGTAPAVTGAIGHATGTRVNQLPATPERVLRAIRERDSAAPPCGER